MLENLYNGLFGTAFFGIALTLLAFKIGIIINQKTKLVICNPLLIAIIIVIAFLAVTGVSYDSYNVGGSMVQFLLTPATIALAVPLYRQLDLKIRYTGYSPRYNRGTRRYSRRYMRCRSSFRYNRSRVCNGIFKNI